MVRAGITPQKSSYGVDDYGYINARIRGMSTGLLGRAELERMLGAENLEALNSLLSATDYGVDIKASEEKFVKGMRQLEVIEDGLKQNFLRAIGKVYSFLEGKPAELVSIILRRWDVFNLKTIIRGKHTGLEPAQIIQTLFFAGALEQDYWEQLARKEDAKGVVDSLTTSHPQLLLPLSEEFDNYLTTRNLVDLELVLDKWYYQQAIEQCDHMGEGFKLVRQFLQAEIDVINAMTCLRLARVDIESEEAQRFYIPGGRIKEQDFADLIDMGGVEDMLSWLENKLPVVRDGLPERIKLYKQRDDISVLERLFEANLIGKARVLAAGSPLGFTILMSYFKRKYSELINLRIILRAVEFGLPKDMVKKELILV